MKKILATTVVPAFALLVLGALSANAQVNVAVPNGSFELDNNSGIVIKTSGPDSTSVQDWVFSTPDYHGTQPNAAKFGAAAPASYGASFAFLNLTPGESGTVTEPSFIDTITAGNTYTLTIAIGNEPGTTQFLSPGNTFISLLGLDDNLLPLSTPLAFLAIPSGTILDGSYQEFSVTYTSPINDPLAGDGIYIQFGASADATTGNVQAAFDNVRLVENAVPEPSVYALMIAGLGLLAFALRSSKGRRAAQI